MSREVPMVACTSGVCATHTPMVTATTKNPSADAAHHRQAWYAATGKDTVQNRANSLHSGACAPVTADRAWATNPESRPTSAPSVDAERTIDRCVDTRW